MLTGRILEDLVTSLRSRIGVLYSSAPEKLVIPVSAPDWITEQVLLCIADAVALLDMLHSMAQLVTVSDGYVRPEFTVTGPLAIRQGSVTLLHM